MLTVPTAHSVRLLNASRGSPVYTIPNLLGDTQLNQLAREGWLLLPQALAPATLARWQAAVDRQCVGKASTGAGLFLRDLPVVEPDLREAMALPPAVSAARCLMGPQVRVRGLSARVCLPEDRDAGFGWHIHHRVWCDPVPAWFSPPQAMDALIYLDGTRTGAGRTAVLPGSHREPMRSLPWDDQTPQAGEVVVDADAGDVVLMHSNLWHRALPATTNGQLRRLLILGLIPSWYRGCPYGDAEGLLALATGTDPEWDRLCGVGGYT